MDALYASINARSTPACQEELNGPTTYCKAIWTCGAWTPHVEAWAALREALAPLEPYGAVFDTRGAKGLLHWTLFQLQTFPVIVGGGADSEVEARDLRTLLGMFPSFSVEFKGISKSRYGLFLNGYPSINVNAIRQKIRETCASIVEPHPQDICHTTLFRFTRPPTPEILALLDTVVERFKTTSLTHLQPTVWEYGYGTWLQKARTVCAAWRAAPRWILHRGLREGPDLTRENVEALLWQRLEEGWDVEVDVWRVDGIWWIGHDRPSNRLQNSTLLLHPRAWIHCKNLEAVGAMPPSSNYFVHDNDPATLTSQGFLWCYPGQKANFHKCVVVLPERIGWRLSTFETVNAVCSDYLPCEFAGEQI
jgi:hypothetical protein